MATLTEAVGDASIALNWDHQATIPLSGLNIPEHVRGPVQPVLVNLSALILRLQVG